MSKMKMHKDAKKNGHSRAGSHTNASTKAPVFFLISQILQILWLKILVQEASKKYQFAGNQNREFSFQSNISLMVT
jgi:hypothetical protein